MKPIINTFAAGELAKFLTPGCIYLAVKQATNEIEIEFFDKNNRSVGIAKGLEVGEAGGPGKEFHYITVKSATAQTVKLAVTGGTFTVNRIAGVVEINHGATLDDIADVNLAANTKTQINVLNSDRRTIALQNSAASLASVRVGGIGIGAAAGLLLDPGQSVTIQSQAEIYAQAIGDTATIHSQEECK